MKFELPSIVTQIQYQK